MQLCKVCKKFIPDGEQACEQHKQYLEGIQKQRLEYLAKNYEGKRKQLYHDPKWQSFSRRILNERPYCQDCQVNRSKVVHHMSYDDPYNEDAVKALCFECHKHYYGINRKSKK